MSRFLKRSSRSLRSPRRTRAGVTAAAALAVLAPLSLTALPASAAPGNNGNTGEQTAPEQSTSFRIASFNLLGAGHTDKKNPDRPKFAKSTVRMGHSVRLLQEQNLSIVGFQEFQAPQFQEFLRLTGDAYGVYPGNTFGALSAPMHNSIVWRKSDWTLLQADTLSIPYGFKTVNGKKVVSRIQMPVLLLQSNATGQPIWVSNFHNAAKVVGPQAHRDEARALEIAMVKRLRAERPTTPVFVLGDLNETSKVFCQFQRKAPLQAAGPGGVTAANKCVTPKPLGVDWIFGSTDVTFSNHQWLRTPLVQKATDHPLVTSDVHVPPARVQTTSVRRVVAVSVDGLRPGYVKKKLGSLPALRSMVGEGVSTMRAHTVADSTKTLPNQLSMITGRPAKAPAGGHGVTKESVSGTVHAKAGRYVPTIFDVAHDNGRSTAVYTTDKRFAAALGSWSGRHGGRDAQGLDNGTDKFTVRTENAKAAKLVKQVKRRLNSAPAQLTYVHLSGPDAAGHAKGFGSAAYKKAVADADKQVGRILKAVRRNAALRGSTLVVLTSSNGGSKRTHNDASDRKNNTVPFVIWGPETGLPAGTDLFSLNPHLTESADQVGNDVATVRNASLPNVVLTALRLPSVPGSAFGWSQHITWQAPAS